MTYAGNSSLSSAVKDRVVSTFQQALALYHQGRTDEVTAGCNLILQMDPMFDPARKLLDKLRNPSLPIDVDSLLPRDPRSGMQQAREAMAERDFQRVIHLTTDILTNDLLNDEARILGDEARDKLEAAPFVEQFTRKCDQQLAAGNVAAAKMDLEKARALDPTHPDVVRVAKVIAGRDAGPRPSAPPVPSFVVDEQPRPAPTGRSAAQAADFGFAFEEDKPTEVSFANVTFDTPAQQKDFANFSFDTPAASSGGFSFDAPTASAAPASSGPAEFDFATASVATTTDDQKKIEQYLTDGDRAFDAGEYQQAIDLWSRIFLIDVTNDDASDRIERAKAKRRELEQRVEPLLTSGITAFERGDTARAHADLTEVLRLDPQNASAQEYLNRLGETVVEGGAAAKSQAYIPPSVDDKLDLGFFEDDPSMSGYDAPLVPPDSIPSPAAAPKSGKQAAAPAKAKGPARKLPVGALAAILGVLVLAAGGWFAWSRFMSAPEADPAATQAILARASMLASTGKYDQAIGLLQDIKPDDPQHDEALVMIADLRAKKNTSAALVEGVPAEQYYTQKLEAARTAFAAHDYSEAKAAFEQAQRVRPLPPDAKAQLDTAAQQVAKLDAAKGLFTERKYTEAIGNLQQLQEQDPQNQNIQRLINDAHFNLGAIALQEERAPDAIREFDEVLKTNPNDELAKRSRDLAARYDGEPKDLLYRIYVKYLPLRNVT
ncbi:MAG TPA: tetratricopeptide repeat protein [Thermoanaerobaculia bacterium]|nr:tetratricopeptide repeat protein [Thermoanaerobaculia bacterium]